MTATDRAGVAAGGTADAGAASDAVAVDSLRERLLGRVGSPIGSAATSIAPDPVNLPMIRHWVDALDDRNPIYLDADLASTTRHGGVVAPPAMLQTWTMARPQIAGIADRGGSAGDIDPDSPIALLAAAGYRGTLATNSELEFVRYLRLGDRLTSAGVLESVSERKTTALGSGYFVTWATTYVDAGGDVVGRQRFRIFKFDPSTAGTPPRRASSERSGGPAFGVPSPEPTALPALTLDVTATVIVAGAIASRDFMPAHHDRDFAMRQNAPDIFMNILTSTGYVSRFVTDWAGPEALLRGIELRLGAPAVPGDALTFTGEALDQGVAGDERLVRVAVRATCGRGEHVSGSVSLSLPRR